METKDKAALTVETTINTPVREVWEYWTAPKHIRNWYIASPDWHTPEAINDVRKGGNFKFRMEARNGSEGFDYEGVYQDLVLNKYMNYTLADGRKVVVTFEPDGDRTKVVETFETDGEHEPDLQRRGWQTILENFKTYAERMNSRVRMHFEVRIHAPVSKVYHTMIDPEYFKDWTRVFNASSRYEGSWDTGEEILFLGEEDGSKVGMVSRIVENIPMEYISIEHQRMIENGEEKSSGPEAEKWKGTTEDYRFESINGSTLLSVDLLVSPEFEGMMNEKWPKALETLKEICEE